jgi:hypothetical protein
MERHGAAHRITSWKPSGGNVTSMSGTLVSSRRDDIDADDYSGQTHEVWQSRGGGYSAAVEHREPAMGGAEYTNYGAGPFKTQRRAQVAAEALGARVYRGNADNYRNGRTQHFSHAEIHYDGP